MNDTVTPFTLTPRDTSCTYVTEQVDTHIHDNGNSKRKITRDALILLVNLLEQQEGICKNREQNAGIIGVI